LWIETFRGVNSEAMGWGNTRRDARCSVCCENTHGHGVWARHAHSHWLQKHGTTGSQA